MALSSTFLERSVAVHLPIELLEISAIAVREAVHDSRIEGWQASKPADHFREDHREEALRKKVSAKVGECGRFLAESRPAHCSIFMEPPRAVHITLREL